MHWYGIVVGTPESPPWVLFKAVDRGWSKDETTTFVNMVVLSSDEVALDPDFQEAVAEFEAGQVETYGRWRTLEEADHIMTDAEFQADMEQMKQEGTLPTMPEPVDRGPLPDDPAHFAYLESGHLMSQVLWAFGDDEEGYIAFWRRLARSSAAIARWRDERRQRLV